MVVQLAYAPLPVASAVGALSLAVAGAGGRPCEHAVQVPAVFVHEPGGASGHQQNGGPSCLQILVRTVHTVQQTVDPHRYSSSMVVAAPVVVQRQVPWLERAETVESPQLQFWVSCSSWIRLLCPLGQ